MSEIDIFSQIDNAVLDLQASHLQTFERPLKNLSRLFNDPSLDKFNKTLISDVSLEEFIAASEKTIGSMVGSGKFIFPDETERALGVTLLLIHKLASNSDYTINFSHTYFYSGNKIISGIHMLTRQLIIPFVRDYKAYVANARDTTTKVTKLKSETLDLTKVFIVHGRDDLAKTEAARFIEKLGLSAIILHEQVSSGKTIIEKIEAHTNVGFAIVLYTPCDSGGLVGVKDQNLRARQNVVFEHGYLIGKLGRHNVCALVKGNVETPNDISGVVYVPLDDFGAWNLAVAKELRDAGYTFDMNKIL